MTRTEYDVAVIGGGSAGVAAAVGAARCGARTVLVERCGFLGGAATAANVLTYCGFYLKGERPDLAVRGVVDDLLRGLVALGQPVSPRRSSQGNWVVDVHPEALKLALDRLLTEAGVALRLHGTAYGATLADGRVARVRTTGPEGDAEIAAAAFVDASGDAALAAMAGAAAPAPPRRQPGSMILRIGGVPREAPLDRGILGAAAARAMEGRAADVAALRANGGHFTRLPGSDEIWWLGLDALTDDLTRAELVTRELAWAFVAALRETGGPGYERAVLAATGSQVGVRDSRRGAAREPLTRDDAAEGRLRDDAVALSVWPMEVHVDLGRAAYASIGGTGRVHVAPGALAAAGVGNLWLAGRVIGCDADAYGSVRVMGTGFSTGQAAGVLAASAATWEETDVRDVRDRLAAQGARL